MADQVRVFVSHHHSPEEDAFTARLVAGLEAAWAISMFEQIWLSARRASETRVQAERIDERKGIMEQGTIRAELERAIREKKQAALWYLDEGTRTVTPYGIRDGTLTVLIEEGNRARTYVLEHIHEVRVLEGQKESP
jgi:hypothetical protein